MSKRVLFCRVLKIVALLTLIGVGTPMAAVPPARLAAAGSSTVLYLPLIVQPCPPPVLGPISNPGGYVHYLVSWSLLECQPALARQELQYDEAPDFGSPTTIPVPIANQRYEAHTPAPGTYYWRVRVSHTGQGWSAWSNVQSVQVSGVRSGSTIRPTVR